MRVANVIPPGAEYLLPPASIVDAGCTVENVALKVDIPIAVDPVRLALKELAYVDAAVRADEAGFDAILINTVADYGIALVRSAVRVPVVGAGEASVRAAVDAGQSFSFVTVWPSSTKGHYERLLRDTGAEAHCRSIRYVTAVEELEGLGGARGVMGSIKSEGHELSQRILDQCIDAIKLDGADTIILGCTCMTGLTKFLEAGLGRPIIDPLHVAYADAQSAARNFDRATISELSPLELEARRQVLDAVDGLVADGASVVDCPVCPVPTV
jgi:allantoin racemase